MTCATDKFEVILDPQEKLDYRIDYTLPLEEVDPLDTIATSTWTITDDDGSLLIDDSWYNDYFATVWLSVAGAKLGAFYKVVNHMVTSNATPRHIERTIHIEIRNK